MKLNLLTCAVVLLLARCCMAQPLFTGFESASLADWTISGDTIRLVGEETLTSRPDTYRWVYFGMQDAIGQQPDFRIGSPGNLFAGSLLGHRFVWSYDQNDWNFFDNNQVTGAEFRFSNDAPFEQSAVYVAYSTPYPFSRTMDLVEEFTSAWFVSPTSSADANYSIGSSADLPLYSLRITNPLVQSEKTRVVLVGGNHSGEMGAHFALEGMLRFLTSDDERARQIRNETEFFVYPQVDPLGRTEGYYRGNSLSPANDHNRFWDSNVTGDNGGFPEIDVVSSAMRVDTDADVDFTLDFHGFFDSGPNFVYTDSAGAETPFLQELVASNTIALEIDDSTAPAGILEFWAKTSDGLNSTYSFTPELSPNMSSAELLQIGHAFGEALYVQLGSPSFTTSAAEIEVLQTELRIGTEDLQFDLNRDGQNDSGDLDFLLRQILEVDPGDTDLDGLVDFPDFLTLSQNFGQPGGWGAGDFDGSGEVDFTDFLQMSRHFADGNVTSVPEPSGMTVILTSASLLPWCRRARSL